MCRISWKPLKSDKRNISASCFGQGYSAPRKMRIMLWDSRCTCVFSVFMVSSLVTISRNSLCIFVTMSCEGSPRAVATVLGCLWIIQQTKAGDMATAEEGAMSLLAFVFNGGHVSCWRHPWGHIFTVQKHPSEPHTWVFPRQQTWKTMSVLSKPQRHGTQRRIPTPQGRHKHPLLPRSPSNGYHSNSDYTRPAVNHRTINT